MPNVPTEVLPHSDVLASYSSSNVLHCVRVAGRVAAAEPLLALLGRTVRARLGVDPALRLLLDAVVADGRGGVDRLVDLALVEQVHAGLVAARSASLTHDAGVAVGLQFEGDAE